MISRAFVSAKSKQENIPFAVMLKACICEELIIAISKSALAGDITISNLSDYSLSVYREKEKVEDLHYMSDPSSLAREDLLAKLFVHLTEWAAVSDVEIRGQVESWGLNLSVKTDGMNVSLKIYVDTLVQLRYTDKVEFSPVFDSKATVTVDCVRVEYILALYIKEIFAKLIYISDISVYQKAYELISTQPVKGRHMMDCLNQMGRDEHAAVDIKRLDAIRTFDNVRAMKKLWEVYARNHALSEESFGEVLETFDAFLRPIIVAIDEGQVFLSDWMPGLKRYFD